MLNILYGVLGDEHTSIDTDISLDIYSWVTIPFLTEIFRLSAAAVTSTHGVPSYERCSYEFEHVMTINLSFTPRRRVG